MDTSATTLSVRVQGGEIIVSLSDFCVIYVNTDQPQLILKRRTETDDYGLLASAQAANMKARELGWIV